ncbi:MAG TPA: hypothetical protein VGD40_13880, partial [Chryseosolibacter sp.]
EAYVSNLKIRPGRFNSVYGAAIAFRKSGDSAKAKVYFDQLIALSKSSDNTRPSVQEAVAFVSTGNS